MWLHNPRPYGRIYVEPAQHLLLFMIHVVRLYRSPTLCSLCLFRGITLFPTVVVETVKECELPVTPA